jgi:uncharacterized protein YdeI (YjbR/CyaY-like superfamily)
VAAEGNVLPELVMPDAGAWRSWLVANHVESDGVRLILAKKGTTEPTRLTYLDALHEALCFGWIDGQAGRGPEGTFSQRFGPRRPRSVWSKRNTEFVQALIDDGRMTPAGQAEIDRAQADGRWANAYRQADGDVPDDLAAAIAANPDAAAMWELLTKQNRFAMTFRLTSLKRPETRRRRVGEYVEMLARGETIHPQKRGRTDGQSAQ